MTLPQDDAHILGSDRAPTPFTADEIREACPEGRAVTLLVQMAGEPAYFRHVRFIAVDSVGASQAMSRFSLDFQPIGETETVYATWRELQAHASFASSDTTIENDTIDSPIGRPDCLRYMVTDGTTVHTFWFAVDLPGMPVRFNAVENGAIIGTTIMITNVTP